MNLSFWGKFRLSFWSDESDLPLRFNSGLCSGELWVDQSDVGVGVVGLIFGHGPIIMLPHLESSVRGSLNLGGECRRRPR